MQRGLILHDTNESVVDFFLQNSNYKIVVLVLNFPDFESKKEKYLNNPRILHVVSRQETWNFADIQSLEYDIISKMKTTQLNVENALSRNIKDYQVRKNIYFNALSFWNNIFANNTVDAVVVEGLNHGYPDDAIPLDLAKFYQAGSFNFENCTPFGRTIYDNNAECFVPLKNKSEFVLDNSLYYLTKPNQSNPDNAKNKTAGGSLVVRTKQVLKNIVRLFDAEYLFICWRYIRARSFYLPFPLYKFVSRSLLEELANWFDIRRVAKYYKKNISFFDKDSKYILFALHLEPEANITTRTVLDSQLVAANMLADVMPDDWTLYVKEHPAQHDLKKRAFAVRIRNAFNYRSQGFYDVLLDNPKIKLLDKDINSQDLIANSQAVSTMSGTAAWEGVSAGKPVLIFGHRTPLKELKDIFKITSSAECERAVTEIIDGFTPDYSDLQEVVSKFIVSKDTQGYLELTTSLIDVVSQRQSSIN